MNTNEAAADSTPADPEMPFVDDDSTVPDAVQPEPSPADDPPSAAPVKDETGAPLSPVPEPATNPVPEPVSVKRKKRVIDLLLFELRI